MTSTCQRCGGTYAAQRSTSRYCSASCKKAAQRARRAAESASVVVPVEFGPVTRATARELEAAGAVDSAMGQCALVLARLIDKAGPGNGSAVSSWVKAHRECMVAALAAAAKDSGPDILDEMRARVRLKRGDLGPA